MASPARMFSKYLTDIRGLVSNKGALLIGINQIRERPAMCLNYDSNILLSNGEKEKIGKLVKEKRKEKVVSFNFKTGKFENKTITNWFNNGIANENEFIVLEVANGGGRGTTHIKCTPDHYVYVDHNTTIKASKLNIGDKVLAKVDNIPTNDTFQLILGSILGDGHLKYYKKGNLLNALKSNNEIMLKCKSYYALNGTDFGFDI
jgi:recombination protein RecA